MVRSVGAVGTFVLGLHKKREKVHHQASAATRHRKIEAREAQRHDLAAQLPGRWRSYAASSSRVT